MPATRERSLYHGWVVLSFFLICGSIAVLSIPLIVADLQESFLKYVLVGAGSLLGGFVAGRTCPYSRLNEIGAAAVAVVLFIVVLLLYTPMADVTFDADAEFVVGAVAYGSISLVFSLIGGFLGDRVTWTKSGGWRQFAVSTLFAFGTATTGLLLLLAVAGGSFDVDGSGWIALVMLTLAIAALVSGALTQAAHSADVRNQAGLGPFSVIVVLVTVNVIEEGASEPLGTIFGLLIVGGILYGFARWGARIAHAVRRKSDAHIPTAVASD